MVEPKVVYINVRRCCKICKFHDSCWIYVYV